MEALDCKMTRGLPLGASFKANILSLNPAPFVWGDVGKAPVTDSYVVGCSCFFWQGVVPRRNEFRPASLFFC